MFFFKLFIFTVYFNFIFQLVYKEAAEREIQRIHKTKRGIEAINKLYEYDLFQINFFYEMFNVKFINFLRSNVDGENQEEEKQE